SALLHAEWSMRRRSQEGEKPDRVQSVLLSHILHSRRGLRWLFGGGVLGLLRSFWRAFHKACMPEDSVQLLHHLRVGPPCLERGVHDQHLRLLGGNRNPSSRGASSVRAVGGRTQDQVRPRHKK